MIGSFALVMIPANVKNELITPLLKGGGIHNTNIRKMCPHFVNQNPPGHNNG